MKIAVCETSKVKDLKLSLIVYIKKKKKFFNVKKLRCRLELSKI